MLFLIVCWINVFRKLFQITKYCELHLSTAETFIILQGAPSKMANRFCLRSMKKVAFYFSQVCDKHVSMVATLVLTHRSIRLRLGCIFPAYFA